MSTVDPDEPQAAAGDLPPEEAAWQSIIENFGERVELQDWEKRAVDNETPVVPITAPANVFGDDIDEDDEEYIHPDEMFVAPRPHLPRTTLPRFVAWMGAVGAPMATVILFIIHSVTNLWIPGWVTWLLIAAFLGGFGYLVATMPKTRDDPFDDGARL